MEVDTVVTSNPQPEVKAKTQELLSPLDTLAAPRKNSQFARRIVVKEPNCNDVNVKASSTSNRDTFRDIQVKVHIRRPERDSWVYLGRGIATQEVTGHSSRVGEFVLVVVEAGGSKRHHKLAACAHPPCV